MITSSVTPDSSRAVSTPPRAVLQPLLGDHPAAEQRALQDLDRPPALLGLVADRVQRGGGQLARSRTPSTTYSMRVGRRRGGMGLAI